jgi:hypothetical protein
MGTDSNVVKVTQIMRHDCPEARTETGYEGMYYKRLTQLFRTHKNLYF